MVKVYKYGLYGLSSTNLQPLSRVKHGEGCLSSGSDTNVSRPILILQVDGLIPIDRSINPMPCCAEVVQSLVENLGLGIRLNGLLFFCFFFMFIGSMF